VRPILGWDGVDSGLFLFLAAAVEEFEEEAEENPGEEEDDGKKDADEEVEVEHVDEGGAGDASHTAELKAGILFNESEQCFHCGYVNGQETTNEHQ
jgi:hypothetical protein